MKNSKIDSLGNIEDITICPIKMDRLGGLEGDTFTISSKTYYLTDIEIINENPNCGMAFQFVRIFLQLDKGGVDFEVMGD